MTGANSFTPILQANPRSVYLAHRDEIDLAVSRVLHSGRYILDVFPV